MFMLRQTVNHALVVTLNTTQSTLYMSTLCFDVTVQTVQLSTRLHMLLLLKFIVLWHVCQKLVHKHDACWP